MGKAGPRHKFEEFDAGWFYPRRTQEFNFNVPFDYFPAERYGPRLIQGKSIVGKLDGFYIFKSSQYVFDFIRHIADGPFAEFAAGNRVKAAKTAFIGTSPGSKDAGHFAVRLYEQLVPGERNGVQVFDKRPVRVLYHLPPFPVRRARDTGGRSAGGKRVEQFYDRRLSLAYNGAVDFKILQQLVVENGSVDAADNYLDPGQDLPRHPDKSVACDPVHGEDLNKKEIGAKARQIGGHFGFGSGQIAVVEVFGKDLIAGLLNNGVKIPKPQAVRIVL
jgi:hypothetical protein